MSREVTVHRILQALHHASESKATDAAFMAASHASGEVYLVIWEGQIRQEGRCWVAPGYRGSVFNPSNLVHAMRSGPKPRLAFWALAYEM